MAATTEAKVAEPKETEKNSEPQLKYKTWVLRVSLHCEGCKRKVTKVLKNIDGVYKTEVDMRLQKVTVTGNVEAETLIKKLTKTGKPAELWPEQKPKNNSNDKKKNKGKGKEKQQMDSEGSDEVRHGGAGGGGGENERVAVKVGGVQVQDSAKNGSEGGSTSKKVDESGVAPARIGVAGGGGQVKEPKGEVVRQGGNLQNQPPAAEKKSGGCETGCEVEESGGGGGGGEGGGASGSGGKREKKKGQKRNASVGVDEREQCGDGAPPSTELPNRGSVPRGPNGPNDQHISQFHNGIYRPNGPGMPPYDPYGPRSVPAAANHGLPPQQVYEYQHPRQHYMPPVQAVSYNTAYPTYGASHYATPAHYNYVTPQGLETELEPQFYHSDPYRNQQCFPSQPSYGASRPSDSFELFSDENPNGCKIM